MKSLYLISVVLTVMFISSLSAEGQGKQRLGRVCGNPNAACRGVKNFQAYDLPFDTGKDFVIAESVWFYGIVLKSVKLKDYGDCEHPLFAERERLEIQDLFPNNKVFTLNCVDVGGNYYKGVADQTGFIGVYAGASKVTADAFLKTVKATGRFPGVRVRRMQIGFNGT